MSSDLIKRLIEAGLQHDLVSEVFDLIVQVQVLAAQQERDDERRERDAERKRVSRARVQPISGLSADVTGRHRTSQDKTLSILREDIDKKERKRESATRGSRIPADWHPSELDWQFALNTIGEQAAKSNLDKFRDYWIAQPGQRGTKLEWGATWRNWVRRVADQANPVKVLSPEQQEVNRNAEEQLRLAEEYRQQKYGRRPGDQGELLG